MCGFVCRVEPDSSSSSHEGHLAAAMGFMQHRGPDASGQVTSTAGSWVAEMGALRLRIIDLRPESDMPMESADGSVVLIYNGELYNADVLRRRLEAQGHVFVGDSDTECLLHLYEEHRQEPAELLPLLQGMFAFCVWDAHQERLFAARDRLGIKPLVYALIGQTLTVASECRALAQSGAVPNVLDVETARAYLRWGVTPGLETPIRDVRRLPPAAHLTYSHGALSVGTWWTLPKQIEPVLASPHAASRLVRSILSDAINGHLISDRPVGLFLSGGTDSRVIATLAAEHGSITALTLSFPEDAEFDETSDAARVAQQLGLHHVVVPVVEVDLEEQILAFISSLDSPSMDALNSWFVCRAAAEAGLVVALSGLGADELVGSYPSFRQVPRIQRLTRPLRALPDGVRLALARGFAGHKKGSRVARVLESGASPEQAYRAVRSIFSSADFARGVLPWRVADPGAATSKATAEDVTGLEFGHFLAQQLLPDIDSVSMAHSLEVRVPFLDHKVVEAVLAIPHATRNMLGKQLLLDAAGIPAAPPKRPFALPMDRWLRGPLKPLLTHALLSEALPFSSLIPLRDRTAIHDQFMEGRLHWSRPWSVAVLRLWPGENGLGAYSARLPR